MAAVATVALLLACGGDPGAPHGAGSASAAPTGLSTSTPLSASSAREGDDGDEPGSSPPAARALRELGTLPGELSALRWPAPPRIARTVEARNAGDAQRAVDRAGTRVRVRARIDEAITVHASDVEIALAEGGRLARVVIDPGAHRVRVVGGEVGAVELLPPARWTPDAAYDEHLFVEDVALEDLRVVATDSAFVIRGRRVAIVGCDVRAERYSLWAGDTGPLDGEDLIVAGNVFRSAGPESTLRMHDVRRSVVVDNVLENGAKHDYRVHGRGDLAYAARNVLVRTGVMIGTQPGDSVGTVFFERNVLHHDVPSLLELEPSAIRRLVLRDNVVYTDRWTSMYPYPSVPDGWTVELNRREPFRPYRADR